MKFNEKEIHELGEAVEIAAETLKQLEAMAREARSGRDIDSGEVWELRNYSQQISATLYNIHGGVYAGGRGVRP